MLVFLNGKAIKYGHKVVRRPDLVEGFNTPSLLEAGFDVLLPKSVLELKMFLKAATAQGVSAFEIAHIGFYFEEIRGGTYAVGAPTDHVQEICGRPPESFETIARRYIAQPDLIFPGLRAGTKLEALAFMVKMMLTRAPDLDRWRREHGHPMLREPVLAHDSRDWREAAEKKQLLLQPTSGVKPKAS